MRRTIIIGAVLALTAFTGGAWASDGCVEISHVNVATAGTISAPGCYVLTSDLSQGLTVNPLTGVTIDLNGFTVAPGSGPAVTLNGPIDDLEIRNGTLESIAGADAVSLTVTGAHMFNHVYRDLRIRGGNHGIFYQLTGCTLEDVQVEDVVVHADGAGVEFLGAEDVVELRNIRFHRTEIRSEGNGILLGPTPGLTIAMRIYGFQVESSSVFSLAGLAAVLVNTNLVAGTGPTEAEFEGSIRDCELVAPDTGGLGVVSSTPGRERCTAPTTT